jgi:hypothetical protein
MAAAASTFEPVESPCGSSNAVTTLSINVTIKFKIFKK